MRFSISLLFPVAICWCAPLSAWSQSTGQVRLVGLAATNHVVSFGLFAPLGRTYQIYNSPDLSTWSLATNGIVAESVPFVADASPSFPRRFYRASIDWTIMLPNNYVFFKTNAGWDGRVIAYPYNWNTNQGVDGRLVAYPPGWSTNAGTDGRLIAYPSRWATNKGPDGRLVAFPATGCTLVTNADGRITVHPTSAAPGAGTNAYVSADWIFTNGADGRQVAYPISNFSTNEGGDGRLISYVSTGWIRTNGLDGRALAYSPAEFTTNSFVGGRMIAYPSSGWVTATGIDGRIIAYPANGTTTIELDFEDQQLVAFIGHLRTVMADPDFGNYIIYTFFGAGEQRFAD